MNSLVRAWRNLQYGSRFAKKGKKCILGRNLELTGHIELGDRVRIRSNSVLRSRGSGKIIIGSRGGLSWNCIIEATELVQIGDFTGLAEFVVIRDTNHAVIGTDEHWRMTPHIREPVIIGHSCLIGARCYIGPGVTIGDGAVLAPGSIVNKNVGPYEVWGGAPARKITHRTENVNPTMLKRYQELVEKYGLRECRYGFDGSRDALEDRGTDED